MNGQLGEAETAAMSCNLHFQPAWSYPAVHIQFISSILQEMVPNYPNLRTASLRKGALNFSYTRVATMI